MKKTISSFVITPFVLLNGMSALAAEKAEKNTRPPNIHFCIADDASYHHFSAVGCRWVNTPHFDRVAREGLLFNNCYTPNAKSAPSRACLLTGRNSWQLKEGGNHITNFPAEFKVFTEALSENGYQVAYTGKGWSPGNPGTVNGNPRQLTGTPIQEKRTTPPTEKMSLNDYAGNFSLFLNEHADDRPWFFWYGGQEPHRDYIYGTGVSLGGKSTDMIDHIPAFWPNTEETRNDMLDYAFEIEYFDKHLGRMMDELEQRGELENTIIIVTSDNGMPFPRSKANNYEYSHHMPLAIMWPAGIHSHGRKINDYISFVDMAPTILDVSQVGWEESGMAPTAGMSFSILFEEDGNGKFMEKRNHVLIGRERDDYGRPQNQGYPIRGIIKDNFLYINNLKDHLFPAGNPETGYLDIDASPVKTQILDLYRSKTDTTYYHFSMGLRPSEELYDLSKDKDCMDNLADNHVWLSRKSKMKKLLFKKLREQEDPRVIGDGDIFDRYPFDSKDKEDFYERVISGEIQEPWKQTRWVNPTDYDQYIEQLKNKEIKSHTEERVYE